MSALAYWSRVTPLLMAAAATAGPFVAANGVVLEAEQQVIDVNNLPRTQLRDALLTHVGLKGMRACVRERIEALQQREYRAPVTTLACKEEREAALACYRGAKGGTPGDIVMQCARVTDALDKCAAVVRDASMSKIIAGSVS